MNEISTDQKEKALSFDIKRSIMLASYIKHWGQPSKRTVSRKNADEIGIEVYEFPAVKDEIYRIATIGVSSQELAPNQMANWELLMCLPDTLVGAASEHIVHYLLDVMAYSLRSDVEFKIGAMIPESPLAPHAWNTKAILVDEARGEAEEMSSFQIGAQQVDLLWLVPLTGTEYQFIKQKGIDEFDRIDAESEVSLLDVSRKSLV